MAVGRPGHVTDAAGRRRMHGEILLSSRRNRSELDLSGIGCMVSGGSPELGTIRCRSSLPSSPAFWPCLPLVRRAPPPRGVASPLHAVVAGIPRSRPIAATHAPACRKGRLKCPSPCFCPRWGLVRWSFPRLCRPSPGCPGIARAVMICPAGCPRAHGMRRRPSGAPDWFSGPCETTRPLAPPFDLPPTAAARPPRSAVVSNPIVPPP